MADITQADRPNYPDNPSNVEDFQEMVKNKPESWFEYFVKLGTYVNALESEHANLLTQADSSQRRPPKRASRSIVCMPKWPPYKFRALRHSPLSIQFALLLHAPRRYLTRTASMATAISSRTSA